MNTPIHDELTAEWFAKELALTDHLAELINDGVPAFTACRMVYDGPTINTTPAVRRAWIDATVAEQIAAMLRRLPWIRGAA